MAFNYAAARQAGYSDDEIAAYLKSNTPKSPAKVMPADPTVDMTSGEQFWAGMGKKMNDVYLGAKQRVGLADQAEVDEARKYDAPLMNTTAGKIGGLAGTVVSTLPALAVPGANTVAGASAVGGIMGLLEPTARDESALRNAALGAAGGAAAQWGLGKAAGIFGDRLAAKEASEALRQSQNAARDETLRAAQQAGYAVTPSSANAGLPSRLFEGLSGKFKTEQLASVNNQNVTNRLARKALGLADDAPLTPETMQAIRADAYAMGYKPIADLPAIQWDQKFVKALNTLVPGSSGRAVRNPAEADISDLVSRLANKNSWTGEQLIDDIRALREQSRALFSSANREGGNVAKTDLARAQSKAAGLLEDLAERNAKTLYNNDALIQNMRDARQLIAKSHSVEDALVEGGGNVNAAVLSAALRKGAPLSGDLETIGKFARNFAPMARVPQSGFVNPLTVLDFAAGTFGAPALPVARIAARYGLLSKPYQEAFVRPTYGAGMADRIPATLLEELRRRGAGGLLGSIEPK